MSSIAEIFTQAASLQKEPFPIQEVSVPFQLSILSSDLEIPEPDNPNSNATVIDNEDDLLKVSGNFIYSPARVFFIGRLGALKRIVIPPSLGAEVSGYESFSGQGNGDDPNPTQVTITIHQPSNGLANVSIHTSDNFASFTKSVSASEDPPLLLIPNSNLPIDQPGYYQQETWQLTLTFGIPTRS